MSAILSSNRAVRQFTALHLPSVEPPEFRLDADSFIALWPRGSLLGADYTSIAPIWQSRPFEVPFWPNANGAPGRKSFTGVTKDSTGAALGSVTVKLFDATTNTLLQSVVSDSAGNYFLQSPNANACYVVAYLSGSPDVAGTTKNNLTGT